MHEMSICEGIRTVIEDHTRGHDVKGVKCVRVEIGQFAGVEKPALEFAFEVVMRGSVAEGAQLIMIDLPGKAMCYDCMHEVEIPERLAPCPDCGGGKLMPTGGEEMRIKDLEVI
ncbi:hydrogenase maturation nickel metallochaperone HypA [Tropicibacter naphthalenivorans]|uniref:Hydrogenase maturation factor HypA n=1 Tax=Tropicibacter naphthalenivorans TaxID=441103 RepID=A0A0P1G286_9RHOB|nr:hydrogenase maturation nickel metallochaperone HypA [Tropicibacter naphthalenivorans]CUH75911.1 Hydrogenase/urease nickel incorporation protein HypA [Tropicibacter naphthalenivorans]SMC41401.1 Hydrogenase-3 nickel incorporation protein HypA [Tropicibacter naphthalenivorans]